MKKLIGVVALVLLSSLPAHAQARGPAVGSSSSSISQGGGAGGAGTGSVGGSGNSRLPGYPPTSFAVSAVSGGDPSFAPSTFLTFDQAVAEGRAINAASQKSLGEIAAENSAVTKAKAKFTFVQNADGNVVPAAHN
jgi:hypothetical protein